jgi:integrase
MTLGGGKGSRELPKNVKALDALGPKAKRVNYSIKGVPGLRLGVHPSGRKVWYGVVTFGSGAKAKRTMVELGVYGRDQMLPEVAIAELRKLQLRARDGEDAKEATTTFGELFALWLEGHAKAKLATWADEERRYRMHLEKPLGSTPFAEIERKDVRDVRDIVAESAGPIQSNRVVALFNRVANWAVDEDRAKFNPAARLKKTGEERRRERILTNDELAQLWSVIDTSPQVDRELGGLTEIDLPAAIAVRRALKLLILTGQRRGEVIGMRKDELSVIDDDAWWILPAERTKNGLPHRVPLTSMAVGVVREALVDAGGSPFLFPSNKTDVAIRGDAVTKAFQRICKRLKIEGAGPHDIRRTIATTLRKLGVSVEDRGHLLNHISGAKSKVTSWNYDAGEHDVEKRAAIEKWEREMRRLVGLAVPTVVQLRAG